MEYADQFFQSWALWNDGFYGDLKQQNLLARPYARAIAGMPNQMHYDLNTRTFLFTYSIDTSITQPTEIYVPPLVYPDASYNITVNENIQWKVDTTNPNVILLESVKQLLDSRRMNAVGIISIKPTH